MRHLKHYGFTLAELLIAIAILGVISTFSIPKVLNALQDNRKAALFKEVIATLNGAFYAGWIKNEITEDNMGSYLLDHINVAKICKNNAQTENCWPQSDPSASSQATKFGAILHNGATIAGLDDDTGGGGTDIIIIDWNGPAPPNAEGDDQLQVIAVLSGTSRAGTVRGSPSYPISNALYNTIFTP